MTQRNSDRQDIQLAPNINPLTGFPVSVPGQGSAWQAMDELWIRTLYVTQGRSTQAISKQTGVPLKSLQYLITSRGFNTLRKQLQAELSATELQQTTSLANQAQNQLNEVIYTGAFPGLTNAISSIDSNDSAKDALTKAKTIQTYQQVLGNCLANVSTNQDRLMSNNNLTQINVFLSAPTNSDTSTGPDVVDV